jgi:hypothetical protein
MIDYAIISSDDNPMYKDFYSVVAKRWNNIGIKTYYINITNVDEIIENEYGFIHKIKAVEGISTGFQSQVVRLFASKFIEGNLIMSDIDMLPINGEYFFSNAKELTKENVVIYTGQPYGNVPYYPMCYVLSHSSNFIKYLGIKDFDFKSYCQMLLNEYGEAWNTDEHFMYDRFQLHLDKLVVKNDRDLTRRVDRGGWGYDINMLKSGHYIDSHMLRPYMQYKQHIDDMIKIINNI